MTAYRRKLLKQQSNGCFDPKAIESTSDHAAIVMQDACTQAYFKLRTSIQSLKEEVDLALQMFNVTDSKCDGADGVDGAANE